MKKNNITKVRDLKNKKIDRYYKNKSTGHLAWAFIHSNNYKKFLSITHKDKPVLNEDKTKLCNVIKLVHNPNTNDKRDAYVVNHIYTDSDNNFSSRKNYKTTVENKKIFKTIIKNNQ